MTMRKLKSFSLIEMVLSLVLVSLVFSIVLYFLIVARDSWSVNVTQLTLQQDLRICLTKMCQELSESTITEIKDYAGQPLNIIQKDEIENILKCLPEDQECVYTTIKFKTPTSRDSDGNIDGWSDEITYTLSENQIIRSQATDTNILMHDIILVNKSSGNGYTYDPNSLGSSFERLASERIKISLVAERKSLSRTIRENMGTIIYLRN